VLVGRITDAQIIAAGRGIRELRQLRKVHGSGRWLKKKGRARVRLDDGTICFAIGKKDLKLKRILQET
jgi:hypothetical protein